jgi:hypothetical protein
MAWLLGLHGESMKTWRNVALVGALVSAWLTCASPAMAASIGINFVGGGGGPGNDPALDLRELSPGQAAGVVPSANWNNLHGADGTRAGLLADTGPTAASIRWESDGTGTAHDTPAGSDGNQVLTNGYLEDTITTGPTGVFFENLPFIGTYDAYVYYGYEVNDRTGTIFTVRGGQPAPPMFNIATNTSPFDGIFTEGTATDDGVADNGEYVRFTGLTGPTLSILIERQGNPTENLGTHGVQLVGVIPEPTGAALLAAGTVGLLARRLRRRRT